MKISTFIRPILKGYFYQFATTNWPIAIILFTVIELSAFSNALIEDFSLKA